MNDQSLNDLVQALAWNTGPDDLLTGAPHGGYGVTLTTAAEVKHRHEGAERSRESAGVVAGRRPVDPLPIGSDPVSSAGVGRARTETLEIGPEGLALTVAAAKLKAGDLVAGADLLVCGAYGRSRAREWLMGGVTRDLVADCPLPCLMIH